MTESAERRDAGIKDIPFKLVAEYEPKGDQPEAIEKLVQGLQDKKKLQTLVGVTGSGKTFTMANVIAQINKPTLVISHNKVLAAQLYSEFKEFFPENAVGYFVSYYDFYQPEAYVPTKDLYIEKEVTINDEIERLRLAATTNLMERRDVIIVASVSCIYGLGSPEDYREMILPIAVGETIPRQKLLRRLVDLQYHRNDMDFQHGTFRVRGDVVEVFPGYGDHPFRIELWGDDIDRILEFNPLTGEVFGEHGRITIYPARHYVTAPQRLQRAIQTVQEELRERLQTLRRENKLVEAQRLEQRTMYDIEMMRETGMCQGIENYSRHLDARDPGMPPNTLIDYFPDDFLLIVDESHIMLPQVRGMYGGDQSRKRTLVEYGFRLPSAMDNRPFSFEEFWNSINQAVFVSATPGDLELEKCDQKVEQLIRPTGLVDPKIIIRPATGQVDDLIGKIRERIARGERCLVTTLTKRMAEELSEFLMDLGIKVHYLHFQVDTIERVEILEGLRSGEFDVIVGVNLLREGLDLPEVSLVAIMDADKEGFLRDERSLIQTCGRAARNVAGEVVMYADKSTKSMQRAIAEMERRRRVQLDYNEKHGIIPKTIQKAVRSILETRSTKKKETEELLFKIADAIDIKGKSKKDAISELKRRMVEAAKNLEFEKAAVYRDKIIELEQTGMRQGETALPPSSQKRAPRSRKRN
ncbi:MAG: excinuclease ABC subunit UvrB [Candidatus Omnitrophota bacterium]|nr:MAG: excinuclease ABC subunit UvrB [Candidatus Omnitrophota bacterium]